MRVRSSRTLRMPLGLHVRVPGAPGGEDAFTVVELGTVVIIIGVMLAAAVVSIHGITRRTEVSCAAEQVKEDLRRAYALADGGEKTAGVRHRYLVEFNNNGESPKNAYRVWKSTTNDVWPTNWSTLPVQKGASYKTLTDNWIQPGPGAGTHITYTSKTITFVPKGSIIQTEPAGNKTVTVNNPDEGKTITITVTEYGSISD
ncbi:MAG: type II secretion system GspH family protein [Actinomycetia bacterium]|nr:type II secretion system GspH family protein [Actinomycetes bacterium]